MKKNVILPLAMIFIVMGSLFTQEIDKDFYLDNIADDFMGVYLPVNYINALEKTKNHSLAIHLNDDSKYHDILIVRKNIINSDSKFHDSYAIKTKEANLYKFEKNGSDRVIIDNNGYYYYRIGNDLTQAYEAAETYITNVVFEGLINQKTGVSIIGDRIKIPFLYFFTGEDSFSVEIDDLFWERGSSLLLTGRGDRKFFFTFFMVTDGADYIFYEEKDRRGPYSGKEETPFFQCNINNDREVLIAAAGLGESMDAELSRYLSGLTEYEKRKITNAMFALNGYSFATKEWQDYFGRYSWYKPDKNIRNDRNILNDRQQRLLDYINK